jgi:hypothetical protein
VMGPGLRNSCEPWDHSPTDAEVLADYAAWKAAQK